MTAEVASTDPRTGQVVETVAHEFTPAEVDARCRTAAAAAAALDAAGPAGRARMLRAMADELEADADAIVALADRESALGSSRLRGELARSSFQLRLFAGVLVVDHQHLVLALFEVVDHVAKIQGSDRKPPPIFHPGSADRHRNFVEPFAVELQRRPGREQLPDKVPVHG